MGAIDVFSVAARHLPIDRAIGPASGGTGKP
jgi:hypothetical protein